MFWATMCPSSGENYCTYVTPGIYHSIRYDWYAGRNETWSFFPASIRPTRVINKRILVELLGIREESVILYLCGMNPLAYLAYFSISKLVYYIINARVIQSNTSFYYC